MSLLQAQNHYNFYQRDTTSQATSSTSGGKISPAILFIIIILAVIFFICGVLHLLVRFFMKQRSSSISQSSVDENENDVVSDTFQRQLQQLFHLHDSGLDQAFIDALPVFQYKEIVVGGLKEPFDCAVCLCEFSVNDKLRLLPLCTHAFHIDCIDKWLLSNSTCPLCRAALYSPGLGFQNPIFDFDDNEVKCRGRKSFEGDDVVGEKKVFPVRLGKFRSTTKDGHSVVDVGETSSLDVRRCYSMGSYEYVVDDSVLQVALCPNAKSSEEQNQDCRTMTVVSSASASADAEARKIINVGSKESLSVSKIWLWSKKGRFSNSSNADFGGVDMSLPWTNKGLAS